MVLDFTIFSEVIVRKTFEVDDRKWRGRPKEGQKQKERQSRTKCKVILTLVGPGAWEIQ